MTSNKFILCNSFPNYIPDLNFDSSIGNTKMSCYISSHYGRSFAYMVITS